MKLTSQTSILDSALCLSNIAASKQEYLRKMQKIALKCQTNHLEDKYQFYIANKLKDQQQTRSAFCLFRCLERLHINKLHHSFSIFKLLLNIQKNAGIQQTQKTNSQKLRQILRNIKQRDNKKAALSLAKFIIRKKLQTTIQILKENSRIAKKAEALQLINYFFEKSQKKALMKKLIIIFNKQNQDYNCGMKDNTFLNEFSSILQDNIFNGVQGGQIGSQKSPYSQSQLPQNQREQYRQVIRQKQMQINGLRKTLTQKVEQTQKLKDSINKYQQKMNKLILNSQDRVKEVEDQQDSKKNSTSPHSSLTSSRNEKQWSSSEDAIYEYCGISSTRKQTDKVKCSSLDDQEDFQQQVKRIKGNHGRYFSQDIPDFEQSISNQETTKVEQQMLSKFMREVFELRQKMDIARQMCSQLQNRIDEGENATSLFATFEGKNKTKSQQQKRIVSQILKLLMPEDMITAQIGQAYGFEAI